MSHTPLERYLVVHLLLTRALWFWLWLLLLRLIIAPCGRWADRADQHAVPGRALEHDAAQIQLDLLTSPRVALGSPRLRHDARVGLVQRENFARLKLAVGALVVTRPAVGDDLSARAGPHVICLDE